MRFTRKLALRPKAPSVSTAATANIALPDRNEYFLSVDSSAARADATCERSDVGTLERARGCPMVASQTRRRPFSKAVRVSPFVRFRSSPFRPHGSRRTGSHAEHSESAIRLLTADWRAKRALYSYIKIYWEYWFNFCLFYEHKSMHIFNDIWA